MIYKHIWTDEAIAIVRDNWNLLGADAIRGLVMKYCKERAEREGRRSWQVPSVGGVIYQALEMGLIDEATYDELRQAYKRKPMSSKVKRSIIERDGGKCLVCGASRHLEVDHIRPVFMGGTDRPGNLQTLCKVCHKIKSISHIDCRDLNRYRKFAFRFTPEGAVEVDIEIKPDGEPYADTVEKLSWRHLSAITERFTNGA